MIVTWLLALGIAVAAATSVPQDPLYTSYPMKPTIYDEGREKMKLMMERKAAITAQRVTCRKEGTCPELKNYNSFRDVKCVDGFAGDFPCKNADLLSFVNITDLGYYEPLPGDSPAGNDIWAWHDMLTGDDYVIAGLTGGSSFVRVTDPLNPVVLGFLYSHTGPASWRDMKVIGDVVYIVADEADHGVQVFDLTQLRGKNDFSFFTETNHYNLIGNVHNIAANIETKTLFCVGGTQAAYDKSCNGGLHMIDVKDPLNPQFAGCYSEDGYVHDTQCVIYRGPDARYQGKEICFCFNEDTLTIVDVTNRDLPALVSKMGYSTSMYTHQGWLTEDQSIVLLDDELDEYASTDRYTKTYIWDVKDLENPLLTGAYRSSETSIDHNQYVLGDYTYQSNYEAGLRILHINQTNYSLQEVAFFDVLPSSTRATFAGTWSNYPWFPGQFVAVESIDYGLFLIKPNYAAMADEVAAFNKQKKL